MSLAAALTRRRPYPGYDPDRNPWDPALRVPFPTRPAPRQSQRSPMQKTLVPDGAPMHPVLGGGRRQRPLLPVFKARPPRRS